MCVCCVLCLVYLHSYLFLCQCMSSFVGIFSYRFLFLLIEFTMTHRSRRSSSLCFFISYIWLFFPFYLLATFDLRLFCLLFHPNRTQTSVRNWFIQLSNPDYRKRPFFYGTFSPTPLLLQTLVTQHSSHFLTCVCVSILLIPRLIPSSDCYCWQPIVWI